MSRPQIAWASNPEKRAAERWFVATSPLWIVAVASVVLSGVLRAWGDTAYLCFGVAVAAPAVLAPWLLRERASATRAATPAPLWASYAFKFNVWVAIVVAFGTYFGTHYFFDLMGMRYAFGAEWTLEAVVVGHSGQRVPVFMYPLTQAYFVTYYAVLVVVDRSLGAWLRPGPVGRGLVVVALAYAVAFAETYFMANEALRDMFEYTQRERMLAVGSIGYAVYFVVGLPMVRRIDEDGRTWSLGRVVVEALATCMMILVALEAWAQLVGPL